jgi:hypothetical protein
MDMFSYYFCLNANTKFLLCLLRIQKVEDGIYNETVP